MQAAEGAAATRRCLPGCRLEALHCVRLVKLAQRGIGRLAGLRVRLSGCLGERGWQVQLTELGEQQPRVAASRQHPPARSRVRGWS